MAAQAGWYVDPRDARQYRYWDGERWSQSTQPIPGLDESGQPGASSDGEPTVSLSSGGTRTPIGSEAFDTPQAETQPAKGDDVLADFMWTSGFGDATDDEVANSVTMFTPTAPPAPPAAPTPPVITAPPVATPAPVPPAPAPVFQPTVTESSPSPTAPLLIPPHKPKAAEPVAGATPAPAAPAPAPAGGSLFAPVDPTAPSAFTPGAGTAAPTPAPFHSPGGSTNGGGPIPAAAPGGPFNGGPIPPAPGAPTGGGSVPGTPAAPAPSGPQLPGLPAPGASLPTAPSPGPFATPAPAAAPTTADLFTQPTPPLNQGAVAPADPSAPPIQLAVPAYPTGKRGRKARQEAEARAAGLPGPGGDTPPGPVVPDADDEPVGKMTVKPDRKQKGKANKTDGPKSKLPVLLGLLAVVVLGAGAFILLSGGDDDSSDIDVAGTTVEKGTTTTVAETTETTAPAAGETTTIPDTATTAQPSATTAPVASGAATPEQAQAFLTAFDAETTRACDAIKANPGLYTEDVIKFDPAWEQVGKKYEDLQKAVNDCSFAARDEALKKIGANGG